LENKTTKPSMTEAIKQFFDWRIAETLHTCLPGKIVKYNSKTRKATVTPLINKKYSDNTILSYKPIESVPVMFCGAGSAILRLPESQYKNQTCLLLFSERALDTWLFKGGEVTPGSKRKFDISDAIAIVGLNSFNNMDEGGDDLTLQYNNSLVRIKKNGMIEMGVNTFSALMTDAMIAIYNSHTHALDIPHTVTLVPTPLLNPLTHATQKVKGE